MKGPSCCGPDLLFYSCPLGLRRRSQPRHNGPVNQRGRGEHAWFEYGDGSLEPADAGGERPNPVIPAVAGLLELKGRKKQRLRCE